jgi:hypothetical protein
MRGVQGSMQRRLYSALLEQEQKERQGESGAEGGHGASPSFIEQLESRESARQRAHDHFTQGMALLEGVLTDIRGVEQKQAQAAGGGDGTEQEEARLRSGESRDIAM